MATKMFNEGLKQLAKQSWNSGTWKALLLMTDTTADTEDDGKDDITDFTALDEQDGSGYARVTLSGKDVVKNDTDDTAKLTLDDITFATLGAGSRNAAGVLIVFDDGGTLRPLSWHEFASPRVADGTDFIVEIRSDTGLIKLSKA